MLWRYIPTAVVRSEVKFVDTININNNKMIYFADASVLIELLDE